MSSYIYLTLDTASPEIEIYSPRYTTNDTVNVITIESNETLSDYQEIYAIDNTGVRHDYTFEKLSATQFVGEVKFATLPIGLVTVYARMKDEVDHLSNLASVVVEIKTSLKTVVAKTYHKSMATAIADSKSKNVKVTDTSRKVVTYDTTMEEI